MASRYIKTILDSIRSYAALTKLKKKVTKSHGKVTKSKPAWLPTIISGSLINKKTPVESHSNQPKIQKEAINK